MPSVKNECRNPACPAEKVDLPSKLKVCGRCRQAAYCSVECQTSHWKEHKPECKACADEGAKLIRKSKMKDTMRWTYNPDSLSPEEEEILMQQWEAAVPPEDLIRGAGITAKEHMDRLGMSPAMVKGLEVGNWHGVVLRMQKMDRPVHIRNDPPLKKGDYVEVQLGNSVKAESVGQRGHLEKYFKKMGKWGIDLEGGTPSMIMEGNLKRVTPDTPRKNLW